MLGLKLFHDFLTISKFINMINTYSESMNFESQCTTCKNELSEGKCTGYPDGIPMDIWTAKRKDCKFYKTLIEEK
jgi:hypothetical protein